MITHNNKFTSDDPFLVYDEEKYLKIIPEKVAFLTVTDTKGVQLVSLRAVNPDSGPPHIQNPDVEFWFTPNGICFLIPERKHCFYVPWNTVSRLDIIGE